METVSHSADPPNQINHPCHDHPLQLLPGTPDGSGSRSRRCNVCRKPNPGMGYHCVDCNNFDVDAACSALELKPTVRFEDGPHLYFLLRGIKFAKEYACEACGMQCYEDLPVMSCVRCAGEGHQRHVHCLPIELPSEVNHRRHIHKLVFKEKYVEDDWGEYYCDVCERPRDADHPVYCCVGCLYFAHVTCVVLEELPPSIPTSKSTAGEDAESVRAQQNKEMEELKLKKKALDDEYDSLRGEQERVAREREEVTAKLSTLESRDANVMPPHSQ